MNHALCRALERIEARAFTDLFAAVEPGRAHELGLEAVRRGGAIALRCHAIDSLLFNRVIGLGVEEPADEATLDALIGGYRGRFFVHHTPVAQAGLVELLERAGLARYRRAWDKHARTLDGPIPEVKTDLAVRLARAEEASDVGAVLAAAFDLPAEGAAIFASVVGRPRWHTFVACDGDAIASVGLLYAEDDIGYLAGGATRPQHRQRGGQGAVMAARVRRALELGCRVVASETGAPAPGDPQHSHRNMERCGLEVVATRDNYAPAGTRWDHGARRSVPPDQDSAHDAGSPRRPSPRAHRPEGGSR